MTLYSGEDFDGESLSFTESDANVAKNKQWTHEIRSVVCQGNPWIIYPDLSFKVSDTVHVPMTQKGEKFQRANFIPPLFLEYEKL